MDAVQQANSGHPGAPMGMADIAEVLWRQHLKHNPGNPRWPDRDRFVLSNGHACMLLYAVLYLTGYPLGIDEIKKFRQLGSHTAGHPERQPELGIETTTGPLGQGIANAVGMALAERILAAQFNRPGFPVVDHFTYFFCGDGCLMEGISHEACSLAGALRAGTLIGFYDDNGISIDGHVEGWYRDDTPKRFEAYGWHVIANVDGQDAQAVDAAIRAARAAHGEALGVAEVAATRQALGWNAPPFVIPADLLAQWDCKAQGAAAEASWRALFDRYRVAHPDLAAEFTRRTAGELPAGWPAALRQAIAAASEQREPQATRQSAQAALNALAAALPELVGGSADLTPSNNTLTKVSRVITDSDPSGNYIHYGVREFAMTAAMNGMALHGGFIPYGGTFLVFSDYARNAVQLACLMQTHLVLVYTHDSIGLGEDGPTHQPIEHLAALRAMPGLTLWRPCDAAESAAAWVSAIGEQSGPTAIVLSRQPLPQQPRTPEQIAAIRRGGSQWKRLRGSRGAATSACTGGCSGSTASARRARRRRSSSTSDSRPRMCAGTSRSCCDLAVLAHALGG